MGKARRGRLGAVSHEAVCENLLVGYMLLPVGTLLMFFWTEIHRGAIAHVWAFSIFLALGTFTCAGVFAVSMFRLDSVAPQ